MMEGPIARERLEANLRLLQKYNDLSDASIATIRAVVENPELVLVAVPPIVESLVGWRPKHHGLIEHDQLTGTTTCQSQESLGPDTEMVWHWTRKEPR